MNIQPIPIPECRTVAELLATPERWARYASAKNELGDPVDSSECDAVCFCLIGAMRRIYVSDLDFVAAWDRILNEINYPSVMVWNDTPSRTHAEVLAAVTKAGI